MPQEIPDLNQISRLLVQWRENEASRREIERLQKQTEVFVTEYMKKRKWTKFTDENSRMTMTLVPYTDDVVDMKQLRYILTASQYAQVVRKVQKERLFILSPEQVETMKMSLRKTQHK